MRYLRSILVVLTGLAFLTLLLVVALYAYLTPDRIQQRLTQALSRDLGMTIVSIGEPSVRHLPKLEVHYPDIRFAFLNSEVSGTVTKASITLNPFALFANNPRVDSVNLEEVSITTDKQHLAGLLRRTQDQHLSMYDIRTVNVKQSKLIVTQDSRPLVSFHNVNAVLENLNEAGASYAADFVAKIDDFAGNGELSGLIDWNAGLLQSTLINTKGTLSGLYAGQELTVQGAADQITSSREQVTLSGFTILIERPKHDRLTLNADWEFCPNAITSPAVSLQYVTLSAPVMQRYEVRTPIHIDMTARTLSAPVIVVSASQKDELSNTAHPNGNLEGSLNWSASLGEGRITLNGQLFNNPIKVDTRISNAVPYTADDALFPKSLAGKPLLSGQVELGRVNLLPLLQAMTVTRLKQCDASLAFRLTPEGFPVNLRSMQGTFTILDGRAHIAQGLLSMPSGDAPFEAQLAEDAWTFQTQWKDIDLADLVPRGLSGQSSGMLSASGQLSVPDKLQLKGSVHAVHGSFEGIDLPKLAQIMHEEQPETPPLQAVSSSAKTAFTQLGGEFHLSGTRLALDACMVQGDAWQASISGIPPHLSGNVALFQADQTPFFTLPVRIDENDRHVWNWTLDWQTALSAAKSVEGELPWNLNRLKNKLLRDFQEWWTELDVMEMELPKLDIPEWLPIPFDKTPPSSDQPHPI